MASQPGGTMSLVNAQALQQLGMPTGDLGNLAAGAWRCEPATSHRRTYPHRIAITQAHVPASHKHYTGSRTRQHTTQTQSAALHAV